MPSRGLYLVDWKFQRYLTQEEADFLAYFNQGNNDGSYEIDRDTFEEFKSDFPESPGLKQLFEEIDQLLKDNDELISLKVG